MAVSSIRNSTATWTKANYGDTSNYASAKPEELNISKADRIILHSLAEKVLELSNRPIEKEKKELWYKHNNLEHTRPLIFIDPENGWNEIIKEEVLKCKGNLARRWEVILRKEIFQGELAQDDKTIEPYFDIGYTYNESDWGMREIMHYGGSGGSYKWDAPIKDINDINKIHFPTIEVDYITTQDTINLAREIFDNLLKIRLKGHFWWGLSLSKDLVLLRGNEQILYDVYDNPKLIHCLMKILRDGTLAKLDFLEKNNLLSLNNDGTYIGSGGLGYIKELPSKDFNGNIVGTKDLWGFTESQDTIGLSPEMFDEFIFKYQLPIQERFGLNYYGCCEPLEKRWQIIKKIPNLRRVSVSPWADIKKMTEYLEDKYIFCRKCNPTPLSIPNIDKESIRTNIREELKITKWCIVEFLMHDNHTIGKNPNNVIGWVKIVREEIDKIYK